jgi:uncharacterized protein YcbX
MKDSRIGTVESLWRYPVKSMRGEELEEAFVRFGGVDGDRLFAFRSSAARAEFPYFTARQQHEMLRYRPRVAPNERSAEVETPDGNTYAIDDPRLIETLRAGADPKHHVTLMRSDRALADAHPVSLISVQTAGRLAEETGTAAEKRRFRANIYLDVPSSGGFAENDLVGRSLRLGDEVVVAVLARDSRCVMINLDPDTAAIEPAILKSVAQLHGGTAGVYGSVLTEGTIRRGDRVEVVG